LTRRARHNAALTHFSCFFPYKKKTVLHVFFLSAHSLYYSYNSGSGRDNYSYKAPHRGGNQA